MSQTTLVGRIVWHAWIYKGFRWALGLVFVYAGVVKLADPAGFAKVIAAYHLAPSFLVDPLALGLPALEVVAGLGLIRDLRFSLGAVLAMLLLFTFVLWFGVLQGLSIDCGCYSTAELAEHDGLRQALYRDLGMLAMVAYLYLWRWRRGVQRRGLGFTFSSLSEERA